MEGKKILAQALEPKPRERFLSVRTACLVCSASSIMRIQIRQGETIWQ